MIGRILFLSAAALVAWRYIRRSNAKVERLTGKPGIVEVLPPENVAESTPPVSGTARQHARISPAAEDLSGR